MGGAGWRKMLRMWLVAGRFAWNDMRFASRNRGIAALSRHHHPKTWQLAGVALPATCSSVALYIFNPCGPGLAQRKRTLRAYIVPVAAPCLPPNSSWQCRLFSMLQPLAMLMLPHDRLCISFPLVLRYRSWQPCHGLDGMGRFALGCCGNIPVYH